MRGSGVLMCEERYDSATVLQDYFVPGMCGITSVLPCESPEVPDVLHHKESQSQAEIRGVDCFVYSTAGVVDFFCL